MADLRKGTYFDGQSEIECRIKKTGAKTTRIVLNDKTEHVVASASVNADVVVTGNDAPERLVPTIPLEMFYRPLRKLKGSKKEQFKSIYSSLNDRHGPKGSVFLAELFRRSIRHAESYSNLEESFHSDRKVREARGHKFANDLVEQLKHGTRIHAKPFAIEFVDYEIFPFRSTMSCCENGKPATSVGSGGMDLLLASTLNGVVLPAIGEIKAASETVGPTFALVQSLMYAAQLATANQFMRLKLHYKGAFSKIDERKPRMDVFVLAELNHKLNKDDLIYARCLADELCECLQQHLRQIVFLSCKTEGNAINGEVIKS